jgi:hypothetical protein
VWRLLGQVGATPADLVAFVADLEPSRLRVAADDLRRRARAFELAPVPDGRDWEGAAAQRYAATADALREHLAGSGPGSLAGRLRATADYVESLAHWQQGLRDGLARTLARVMTSAEAVTLRLRGSGDPAALAAAVAAAADIGAALLAVGHGAAAEGRDVVRAAAMLDELPYRPPSHNDPLRHDRTIRLS